MYTTGGSFPRTGVQAGEFFPYRRTKLWIISPYMPHKARGLFLCKVAFLVVKTLELSPLISAWFIFLYNSFSLRTQSSWIISPSRSTKLVDSSPAQAIKAHGLFPRKGIQSSWIIFPYKRAKHGLPCRGA